MSMRFSYDKRGIRRTVRVISRIQDLGQSALDRQPMR